MSPHKLGDTGFAGPDPTSEKVGARTKKCINVSRHYKFKIAEPMSNIVGICLTLLISYCNNNMRNVSIRGTQIRAISMHSEKGHKMHNF